MSQGAIIADYRDYLFEIRSRLASARSITMLLIFLLVILDYMVSVGSSFWDARAFSALMVIYLVIIFLLLVNLLQVSNKMVLFKVLLIGHRVVSFQSARSWNSRLSLIARTLLSFAMGVLIVVVIVFSTTLFGLERYQNIVLLSWIFSLLVFAFIVVLLRILKWVSGREIDIGDFDRDEKKKKTVKDVIFPFLASLFAYLMRYTLDSIFESVLPSLLRIQKYVTLSSVFILFLTTTTTFLGIITFFWGLQTFFVLIKERKFQHRNASESYMKKIFSRKWGSSWLLGGSSVVGSLFLVMMTTFTEKEMQLVPTSAEVLLSDELLKQFFTPSIIHRPSLEMLSISSLVSFVLALFLISLRPTYIENGAAGVKFSRLLNFLCLGGTIYSLIFLYGYSLSALQLSLPGVITIIYLLGIGFAIFMAFSPYFYSIIHVNRETALLLRQHFARDILRFKEHYKGIFFDKSSLRRTFFVQASFVFFIASLVVLGGDILKMFNEVLAFTPGNDASIESLFLAGSTLENVFISYLSWPFVFIRLLLHGYMLLALFFIRFEVPLREIL